MPCLSRFQSTLPARGATTCCLVNRYAVVFQSTLPARGATCPCPRPASPPRHFNPRSPHGERQIISHPLQDVKRYFNPRSPHGERLFFALFRASLRHFNPRSPHGERRDWRAEPAATPRFQSTLPARGATKHIAHILAILVISIHAPRTGSDQGFAPSLKWNQLFQSTLPARGATSRGGTKQSPGRFQSTLPARGATTSDSAGTGTSADFNPRSPHGERRAQNQSCL